MWVYWITLSFLSMILYFPYKRFFSKEVALRTSVATFILGMSYPLLQANLSFWQTLICLGLLLLFIGTTISRKYPQGDVDKSTNADTLPVETPEEVLKTSLQKVPTFIEQLTYEAPEKEHTSTEQHTENQDILVDSNPDIDVLDLLSDKTPELNDTGLANVQEETQWKDQTTEGLSQGIAQDIVCNEVVVVAEEVEVVETAEIAEKVEIAEALETVEVDDEIVPTQDMLIDEPSPLLDINYQQEPQDIKTQGLDQPEQTEASSVIHDAVTQLEISENPVQPSEPQNNIEVTPQFLLSEGLRLSKTKNYAQAVRYFNQIISSNPEPEILYLAVSELSSLYQHLGLYPMASNIIKAFVEHPNLLNHPGLDHLIQKMKFIECLTDLLKRDHYGQIPYDEIPEAVRREAFDNSLNIKRLFS